MTPARLLRLDQIIEGTGATVEARLGADGSAIEAWFAMEGLPRIEPLLLGRPVAEIPGIVERICGICPAAHHLAGVRTFEALTGAPTMTPTADAMRRLLHHGAVLQTHAQALTGIDAVRARDLGGFARRVLAAAGGDSHFPRCAVPGGVLSPLPLPRRDELLALVDPARGRALELLGQVGLQPGSEASPYGGHDVALVDALGALDLYGDRLRAVTADGTVTIDGAGPEDWVDLVSEARPGSPAPRPYLHALGPGPGAYRVGPVAQLRAATRLRTPLAEEARQRWSASDGDAVWARAVVTLHAIEVIDDVLGRPELVSGPVLVEIDTADPTPGHQASGWVDGARGLLVHTYRTDDEGLLSEALITTPTAQNEAWLAQLLGSAVQGGDMIGPGSRVPTWLQASLEAAIREADPCLPCTSTPHNRMSVRLRVRDADEAAVAEWLLEGAPLSGEDAPVAVREGR